ncbi:MAG: lamin tail domain-containing protein, partial [Planctomycetales bacterium]|nr:lamin tail domain-containing protein [Planctomycetales bacterium]
MKWVNRFLPAKPLQISARRTKAVRTPRRTNVESLEARQLLTADVVINEFVASNDSTLETIAGKTPDWIELHNRSTEAVDLTGWQLRDSSAIWDFPSMDIEPDGYLVVFASGDNFVVTEPRLEIHTNFKLKAEGEYLGLLRPDGTVAHEFNPYTEQITDQSFGLPSGETFAQFFSTPTPGAQNPIAPRVVISELMSSNQSTLADEDGDYADWLEIYNDSDSPTNLNGWSLETDGIYWEFPEVVVEPNGYLLVFASGNDRRELDSPLHTNFKLGSRWDELYLYRPDGSWAHGYHEYPPQQVDVSYGLTSDLAEVQFFKVPTPGAANLTGFQGVRFSPGSTIIQQDTAVVTLTTELENSSIRYTTDGTEPTEENGNLYSRPFPITQSTLVTATVFSDGMDPTTSRRSYVLEKDIRSQSNEGKPQTWGFAADYEMDPDVPFNPWVLSSTPSVMLTVNDDDLFSIDDGIFANPVMVGDEWARDVEVEFIPVNNSYQANNVRMVTTGKIRTTGLSQERNPAVTSKFSMEIEFDTPLEPSATGNRLFTDLKNPQSDVYSGIMLRAGRADSWLATDAAQRENATYARSWFVRASQRAMQQPAVESSAVNVFINNMYWGIYDMTDRPSAAMAAELLGGNASNYDVVDENGAIDGNTAAWDALLAAAQEDLSNPDAFQAVAGMVNVENLIDFIILKRYAEISSNAQQSWFAARHRNRSEGFHFFFNDNPESLGLPQDQTQTQIPNPFYAPEFLFEQMMQNDAFKRTFADRARMHTADGGALGQFRTASRWFDILAANQQVHLEAARWGDYRRDANPTDDARLYSSDELYQQAYQFGGPYFSARSSGLLDELASSGEFPEVPPPTFVTPPGTVRNGHRLDLRSEEGVVYYTTDGSDPVNLDGSVSDSAEKFTASIRLYENTRVRARTLSGTEWSAISDGVYLMAEPVPLKITEIMYHPALNDPNSPYDDDDFEFIEI